MILRAAAAALVGVTGLYLIAWRVAVSFDESSEPHVLSSSVCA